LALTPPSFTSVSLARYYAIYLLRFSARETHPRAPAIPPPPIPFDTSAVFFTLLPYPAGSLFLPLTFFGTREIFSELSLRSAEIPTNVPDRDFAMLNSPSFSASRRRDFLSETARTGAQRRFERRATFTDLHAMWFFLS